MLWGVVELQAWQNAAEFGGSQCRLSHGTRFPSQHETIEYDL
jgi:hypothetical protein